QACRRRGAPPARRPTAPLSRRQRWQDRSPQTPPATRPRRRNRPRRRGQDFPRGNARSVRSDRGRSLTWDGSAHRMLALPKPDAHAQLRAACYLVQISVGGSEFMQSPILAPVVALVLWSFVMWAWLYATRLPVVIRSRTAVDPTKTYAELQQQIPPNVRWKADNYNNLMEQPTLFYAIALTLALTGEGAGLNLAIGWLY